MSLEVTINVPGLKELAEAISRLAGERTTTPLTGSTVVQVGQKAYGEQIAKHFPEANVTSTQQESLHQNDSTQAAPTETVPTETVPTEAVVPTSVPSYTREELSKAAMQLMDKGMQPQLMQLIQSFGVASLVELPAEQYGNFATGLRGLGAQI